MSRIRAEERNGRTEPSVGLSALAVLLLSAAVIALELALMRCLAIARWHHFSYLVISTALLGFGASGTLLTFAGGWLRRRFTTSCAVLTILFAISVTLSFRAAEALPLDARYVLYSGRQAALMLLYHCLLFIPFLLGATVVGLSLTHLAGRVHLVYGANLIGSGLGGALAVGLMFVMPAERLLHAAAGLGVLAGLVWALSRRPAQRTGRRSLMVLVVLLVGAGLAISGVGKPLKLRVDQYKMLSVMRRWEADGSARRLLTRHGPRARLDVYDSPLLHRTMFAGLTAVDAPPAQLVILADGDPAATVFKIDAAKDAEILDHTPMSVPYRLLTAPRVLLLGETGGANVWLARRMGAEHVTVVQSNPQLIELMRGPLARMGGEVLTGPDVTVVTAEPRAFLERTRERFDLIQVVTAEGMAAGGSGLRALHEDFLLTRQGLALCIERLTDAGVVAVTRGVQAPPRDNVKVFATLRASLESLGERKPGLRLVQVRNYLAATTMAFRRPVSQECSRALASVAQELALDVEWAPGLATGHGEQVNYADGPPGKPYSYFHHAALQLLSGERERFFRDWAYNVRPATDDSPYFYNFFRWRSLPDLMDAYGEQWLRRTELGYVVLVFALVEVVVVGATLILLPLLWLRRRHGVRGRLATGTYFVLLGLGYMMLEMVCLLKFAQFLGDPIYAAAGIISSFLVFSGLGSALSRRLCPSPQRAIWTAALGVAALAVLYAVGLSAAFRALVGLPLAGRFAASVALTAPAAFLMGWPFPNGLTLLERGSPPLLPWAWGANGFASVAASPLAVMIAIAAGYSTVLLLVAALYLLAAVISLKLPRAAA